MLIAYEWSIYSLLLSKLIIKIIDDLLYQNRSNYLSIK